MVVVAISLASAPARPEMAVPHSPSTLPDKVTVRIWELSPPSSLRALPRDSDARMRACDSCQWTRAAGSIALGADGARVRIVGANGDGRESGVVRLSGAWRLELPDNGSANSPFRASIAASGGRLQVTLALSMEEYVAGVIAAEARGFTSPESLKAMAVAVRTYATRFRGRHRSQAFDFCDSTHCQALRLSGVSERFLAAARATAGEILLYNGKAAATYYHRDCGGTTEAAGIAWHDANAPYLKQQADPYCTRVARDTWSTEIPQADLARALTGAGIQLPPGWHGLQVVTRTPSGRARKLRLVGTTNLLIAAATLRLAVARTLGGNKVRSDLFSVESDGDGYIFSGVGSGHGIGLCQMGAAEMGSEGKNYGDILAFYYPGTTLRTPAQTVAQSSGY